MRIFLIALACGMAPTLAFADTLDRYRDAVTTQAVRMQDFMVSRVPEMADVLTSVLGWPVSHEEVDPRHWELEVVRGGMINDGRPHLYAAWSLSVFPGIAIVLIILAFNLLGDHLRDALDPHLAQD